MANGMSFDRLARHYRWMEAVLAGGILQHCRTAFIDQVEEPGSALLLGEGNGRYLSPFLQLNRSTRVVCVEQSARMISCAKRALQRQGIDSARVEFIQADLLTWDAPAETFDLIVSHFFLDCFTEAQLRVLVPRIAAAGRGDCVWIVSDFQIPEAGFWELRARVVHKLMYAFFHFATGLPARRLTQPDALLADVGFELARRVTAQRGLLRSDQWVRRQTGPALKFDQE